MKLDFMLTREEKKKLLDIELKEDYLDLWGYKAVIPYLIPLVVFYIPLSIFQREGNSENFIILFKLAFVIYGLIAFFLKGIEIITRKAIYKKRKKVLMGNVGEDEKFHLEISNSTIFLKSEEKNKEINMFEIIDVLEIDEYLAICYGEYGEYIFIPLREFNDGRLYSFLASVNNNLK